MSPGEIAKTAVNATRDVARRRRATRMGVVMILRTLRGGSRKVHRVQVKGRMLVRCRSSSCLARRDPPNDSEFCAFRQDLPYSPECTTYVEVAIVRFSLSYPKLHHDLLLRASVSKKVSPDFSQRNGHNSPKKPDKIRIWAHRGAFLTDEYLEQSSTSATKKFCPSADDAQLHH